MTKRGNPAQSNSETVSSWSTEPKVSGVAFVSSHDSEPSSPPEASPISVSEEKDLSDSSSAVLGSPWHGVNVGGDNGGDNRMSR